MLGQFDVDCKECLSVGSQDKGMSRQSQTFVATGKTDETYFMGL